MTQLNNSINTEDKSALLKKTVELAAAEAHRKKTDEVKSLFNEILTERKKFPEILFISNFLPMFSGEVSQDDEKLKQWYSIAGSPFDSVDLMDGDGEVVYTVPAVLDRSILKMSNGNGGGINTLFQSYNNMLQLSPSTAEAMVANELSGGLLNKEVDTSSKLIEDWKKLLSHYGKDQTLSINKASLQNSSDLDMEFD